MTVWESDDELLRASRAGASAAFGKLVDRYRDLVCAITYCATGDVGLSEDLAQDTFVAAWHGLPGLHDQQRFRGWLCTIARNLARNACRDRARVVVTDAPPEQVEEPASEVAERADEEALVWRALESMPLDQREPLVLFHREGRSTAEIAVLLGISVSAAEQRLSRARRRLREQVAGMVERTLTRTRPRAGFTSAVLAGIAANAAIASDAIAATEAAAIATTKASTRATIVTIAIKTIAISASIATLAYGCASLNADEELEASAPAEDRAAPEPDAAAVRSAGLRAEDTRAARERHAVHGGEVRALPRYEITRREDGRVAVALAGGEAAPTEAEEALSKRRGPLPDTTARRLYGRVLGADGRPVAGAVVIGGGVLLSLELENINGESATTTDAAGRFRLPMTHAEGAVVLALSAEGWSPLVEVEAGERDARVDLRVAEPASLHGTLRYDGAPHVARVILEQGDRFMMIVTGEEDGAYAVPHIPTGELTTTVVPFESGQRLRSHSKTIDFAAGQHINWDVVAASGLLVAVTPVLPESLDGHLVTVSMLPGKHPPSNPSIWQKRLEEIPFADRHWTPVNVAGMGPVAEFEAVEPGAWTVCAQAQPNPSEPASGFACTQLEVKKDRDLTTAEIAIVALDPP